MLPAVKFAHGSAPPPCMEGGGDVDVVEFTAKGSNSKAAAAEGATGVEVGTEKSKRSPPLVLSALEGEDEGAAAGGENSFPPAWRGESPKPPSRSLVPSPEVAYGGGGEESCSAAAATAAAAAPLSTSTEGRRKVRLWVVLCAAGGIADDGAGEGLELLAVF